MTVPVQPLFPYLEIYIAGKPLHVPANYVMSFEYTDTITNSGDEFSLELFDPTWDLLESSLLPTLHHKRQISFRWGYGADRMTKPRYGKIRSITPGAVTRVGARFTIKGLDEGSMTAVSKKPKAYRGKISEIVVGIAKEEGWTSEVTETDDVLEANKRDKKGKFPKVWVRGKRTVLEFVNMLAQRARSGKTPGAFLAYFDSSVKPPVLHFHPAKGFQKPISRSYVVQTGRMGEVISFDPEVDAGAFTAAGLSEVKLLFQDPHTREQKEMGTSAPEFKDGVAVGKHPHVEGGVEVDYSLPPMTEEEMKARLMVFYDRLSNVAMTATLEVVGDPDLQPNSLVKVLLLTPRGIPYYTSGIYLCHTVTHKIQGGSYTCSLALNRNAVGVGVKKGKQPLANAVSGGK